MLAATLLLIVPLSRQKNISWKHALLLAFGLWLVSLFLGGICLRSTRRKRKRRHSSRSTPPASLNDGESIDPPPTGTAAEGPN